MADFAYEDLLPIGADETPYRLLTTDGVRSVDGPGGRTFLEVDVDNRDPKTGTRLLRYKTTRYVPHVQRAEIRFLYDKFPGGSDVDRYVSDFDSHVYYPREVELLFRLTGFRVEAWFGDYAMRRLRSSSRQLIAVGVKGARPSLQPS